MIDKLLNIHRIKFTVLDNLFKDSLTKVKNVNIHIDLHSILASLYEYKNHAELNWHDDKTNMIVSSCIINLAAHYRLFFFKHKIKTFIFFYYGNEKPRNNSYYYPEYGYKFFDKYSLDNEDYGPANKEITQNLKLVKIISDYVPYVYYINSKFIEPMIACAHNIINYVKADKDIIITKDPYWYQCLNFDSAQILRLKRDESYLIDKKNLYEVLLKDSTYETTHVNQELLSIVYSFAGIKTRDVKGLSGYGYTKICKVLDLAIERGLIKSSYTHIKNILDEIYKGTNEKELLEIFKAIDMRYQLNELTVAQKEQLTNCIVDKFNKKDILKLNEKIYTGEYSLMIEELFKVEESYTTKKLKW
jgi:hypothetical protein